MKLLVAYPFKWLLISYSNRVLTWRVKPYTKINIRPQTFAKSPFSKQVAKHYNAWERRMRKFLLAPRCSAYTAHYFWSRSSEKVHSTWARSHQRCRGQNTLPLSGVPRGLWLEHVGRCWMSARALLQHLQHCEPGSDSWKRPTSCSSMDSHKLAHFQFSSFWSQRQKQSVSWSVGAFFFFLRKTSEGIINLFLFC